MYKTSFALATLLAFADALYLGSSCCPTTCCDGGDGDEPNKDTQELIDNIIDDQNLGGDGETEEGAGDEDLCTTIVDQLFSRKGFTRDQSVSSEQVLQLINYEWMNNFYSRQKCNHWFELMDRADADNDNQCTFDEVVAVCYESDGADFDFQETEDNDYLRDHPLEDLVEEIMDITDADSDDIIRTNYQEGTHLPALLESGEITQEEKDWYSDIFAGTVAMTGDPAIHRDEIYEYLEDSYYYFDWQGDGEWMQDTT